MPRYRPNVAFILRNSSGEILVCERSDWPGCWQFPQGGVKKNETLLEALHREVEEELGLRPAEYRLLSRKGPYRYLFTGGRKKAGYDGQEQQYFLGEAVNPHVVLRFDATHEFRAARWLPPADYTRGLCGGLPGFFRPRDAGCSGPLNSVDLPHGWGILRPDYVHTFGFHGFIERPHRGHLVGLPERFRRLLIPLSGLYHDNSLAKIHMGS